MAKRRAPLTRNKVLNLVNTNIQLILVRATKVNAGLAESNGRLLLGIWRDSLHVTYGLTACTPGSAPGPTLGN